MGIKVEFEEGMSDKDKIRYLWSVIAEIKEKTKEDLR